jgi:ABC-type multidrug transport system fused ATPase/permease subunit
MEKRRVTEPVPDTTARRSSSALTVLRAMLARHRWPAIGLMGSALIAGLAESTILALVAQAATAMVDGDERVVATLGPVAVDAKISAVLAIAGVLATIRLVLQLGLAYLPARMASDTQAELREELFGAYSRASWEVQAEERDGHLQELLTNQIPQATQASLLATQLASAGLTFLTLVLAAFLLGPIVAVLVLLVAVLLAATLRPLAKHGRRHATLLSRAQVSYASSLGTSVRLAEETYTFGVAAAERERLGREADAARHHYLWTQFSGRLTQGLYQGLVILLLVGGLAGLLAADTGRIASLGGVVLILVRASSYGQQAQVAWHSIQQAAPYLDRLSEAKEQYLANPSTSGDRPFPASAALRFASVSFAYRPDRPVLRAIDLEAAPGEVLGIVGPSGAGKSTLVQLLMRMRSPTDGTIELGGVPIDEISLDEWRRHVAYVPQEPRLLHATVADNIRFARDLDDAAIERSAQLAHIHDDIVGMPDGYDTVVGQRADAVSGGQRQRLCVARALAGQPDILVLDEPTSALDRASEVAIQASLLDLHGSLTMFIVTHRPSLLEICHRVIQIDEGGARTVPVPAASSTQPAS